MRALVAQLFKDKGSTAASDEELTFEEANAIKLGNSNEATLNRNADIIKYIGEF